MKKIALAAALAILPAVSMAAGPEMIVNGSFEDIGFASGVQQLANGSWTTYAAIPGWTLSGGHSIEVRNNVAGKAYDGVQFVELDSYANSGMAQTIATTAGAKYDLSFWYSPRPGTGNTNDIQAFWNGVQLGSTLFGTGGAAHNWTQHSFTVTGTGSDVLRFVAVGTNDSYGGSLDLVSMTAAVPEPETYAMMLAGLGMMGAVARRRRLQG